MTEKPYKDSGMKATIDDLFGTHVLKLNSTHTKDVLAQEEKQLTKSDVLQISQKVLPSNSKKVKNLRRTRVMSELTPVAPKFDVSALDKILVKERPVPSPSSTSWAPVGRDRSDDHWHDIEERKLTPEEERDLRILENRQHLDPKRFYKSTGTGRKRGELPSRVHFGTVVVGAHEFYSARLTKRERRSRIIDEVLADKQAVSYIKKKGRDYQLQKSISKRVVDPAARRQR